MLPRTWILAAGVMTAFPLIAQQPPPGFNYDETKVPAYTLPDPLVAADGVAVKDAAAWRATRRPELVALFEREMYGVTPPAPRAQRFIVREQDKTALGGRATRKQVRVLLTGREDGPAFDLLIYVPNTPAGTRAPAFLGLNFSGNHTVQPDPQIALPLLPMPQGPAKPMARGGSTSWPVDLIVSRGFALVTIFYGDIEPDRVDGWKVGVRGAFGADGQPLDAAARAAAVKPSGDWGALAGWGWALSRAMDYLETDADIDASRVALLGHSRLGKAALWAGARDERFAMVVAAQSGEGGAAITRRQFGETIARINDRFPHWFDERYKSYNGRENDLPVDAHELVALVAPRPVYVSSATEDLWADPRGEFLAARGAEPVYRLFGKEGLGVTEMPPPDRPVGRTIGYHLRTGKHEVTRADWEAYLTFAARELPPNAKASAQAKAQVK